MANAAGQARDLNDLSKVIVSGKAGEVIFKQGDASTDAYLIEEGQIELLIDRDGTDRQLAVLDVGDFFGELSLLEGTPRDTSARALSTYRLVKLDRGTFEAVVQENAAIAIRMIQILSHRLHDAQQVPLFSAVRQPLPAPSLEAIQSTAPAVGTGEPVLFHPASAAEFRLAEGRDSTLGRLDRTTRVAPDVDLATVDSERTLSRRHAKILRRNDGLFLREEEGVRNGTFVNGVRLAPGTEVRLKHGDQIRLGRVDLIFTVR
jgi:hypothetical protein